MLHASITTQERYMGLPGLPDWQELIPAFDHGLAKALPGAALTQVCWVDEANSGRWAHVASVDGPPPIFTVPAIDEQCLVCLAPGGEEEIYGKQTIIVGNYGGADVCTTHTYAEVASVKMPGVSLIAQITATTDTLPPSGIPSPKGYGLVLGIRIAPRGFLL